MKAYSMMNLKKISGFQIFSIFYLVSGIILLIELALSNPAILHLGVLGILSLIVSYGLFKIKKWALYAVILVSLLEMVFGIFTVYVILNFYSSSLVELIVLLGASAYVIMLFLSLPYVIIRREKLT